MKDLFSEHGETFAKLKLLFTDTVRRIYSDHGPFIKHNDAASDVKDYQKQTQKANITTFLLAVLGGQEVGFNILNDFFLDIFVPLGSRLSDWQATLFLELKTQAYIAALQSGQTIEKDTVLAQLFPRDLEDKLRSRHPDTKELSSSEHRFVSCVNSRRDFVAGDSTEPQTIATLSQRYEWMEFLKQVDTCLKSHLSKFPQGVLCVRDPGELEDAKLSPNGACSGEVPAPEVGFGSPVPLSDESSSLPHPSQSLPTSILYKRARVAHDAKHAPLPKQRLTGPSARRPWTTEEEQALMLGLDKVKGPHWSQILAMYGSDGTISDVLRERTQVQLKDKARNLKLFFLKTGFEVPFHLRNVTGDLKRRAGGEENENTSRRRTSRGRDMYLTLTKTLQEPTTSLRLHRGSMRMKTTKIRTLQSLGRMRNLSRTRQFRQRRSFQQRWNPSQMMKSMKDPMI